MSYLSSFTGARKTVLCEYSFVTEEIDTFFGFCLIENFKCSRI